MRSNDEDHPLWGIFWMGDGTEVQRDDTLNVFPGDMEAAIAVAERTESRWLVFEECIYPEAGRAPWQVFAYADIDDAHSHVVDAEVDARSFGFEARCFVFDGRRGIPPDGPNGIGYIDPSDMTWEES